MNDARLTDACLTGARLTGAGQAGTCLASAGDVRSLAYLTDLAVLRCQGARIQAGPQDRYLTVRTPGNPEFWWGNFLLLPERSDRVSARQWTADFAEQFPDARHMTFGLDGAAPPAPAQLAEFQALGFEEVKSSVLTATRAVPRRTPQVQGAELVLRPLHSGDDWHQALNLRLAVNAAGDRVAGYFPFAQARLRLLRAAQRRGEGAAWGAFVGGQLRASLGIYRGGTWQGQRLARYQDVETHPDWRSRGLAGALVCAAGDWARGTQGLAADTLVIVADPAYHAQALYQSLGFAVQEYAWGLSRPPTG